MADWIVAIIRSDDLVTVQGIADVLGTSKRTVEREIKKLRESGRIVRQGGNRHGSWKVND